MDFDAPAGTRTAKRTITMAVTIDSPALTPEPLGDVTLAPFAMTRRSESDLAHAMVQHLGAAELSSGAEALRALRNAFPTSPLATRVMALGALIRR
ncbi:MAG: hypothetical protein V7604_5065 [Hyphomicrobiales bacterium]|jgi:hypothetical protein